jgi:hypothetical protein
VHPSAERRADGADRASLSGGLHIDVPTTRLVRMESLVSSWISPRVRKGVPSPIDGRGLVAVGDIARDEVVAVKGGHIIDVEGLARLPEHLRSSEIQIAEGLYLAARASDEYEPVMLFINHSCEPNVGFAGNIVLVAMRDIRAGAELTTDYALFDTPRRALECHCGAPSCRRSIRGTDWMLPELQTKYDGYFSSYVQRRIARMSASGQPVPAGGGHTA